MAALPDEFAEPGIAAIDFRINRDDSAPNRSRRKYSIPPAQDGSIPTVQDTITVDFPNVHAVGGGAFWGYYPSTFDIPDTDMPQGYPGA